MKEILQSKTFPTGDAYCSWYNENKGYSKIRVLWVVGKGQYIVVFFFADKEL